MRSDNLKFKRMVCEHQTEMRRARNDAENAKRICKQTLEITEVKLTMATALSRFYLDRIPRLQNWTEARNTCLICPENANIQTNCIPPHKFCNTCMLRMADFKSVYATGRCPVCRTQITNICDVEYSALDDPDEIEKNKVSVLRITVVSMFMHNIE